MDDAKVLSLFENGKEGGQVGNVPATSILRLQLIIEELRADHSLSEHPPGRPLEVGHDAHFVDLVSDEVVLQNDMTGSRQS
jgi:hypothetical protein